MTNEEFEVEYPKFKRSIHAIARKIAGANDLMFDDLLQVGRVSLWQFDLTKVQTNVVGCVNRHLRNRMIDYVRAETGGRRNAVSYDPTRSEPHLDGLYLDESGNVVEIAKRHAEPPDWEYRDDRDNWI